MIEFKIDTEYIELVSLLKVLKIAESGGMAKQMVNDQLVLRNDSVELRKRAKLIPGDVIEIFDYKIIIK